MKIVEPAETMYTNQTGTFPVTPIKGNRYVMVATQVDGNVIISEPMKKRTAGELVAAHQKIMKHFKRANIIVKKHVLDNKFHKNSTKNLRTISVLMSWCQKKCIGET